MNLRTHHTLNKQCVHRPRSAPRLADALRWLGRRQLGRRQLGRRHRRAQADSAGGNSHTFFRVTPRRHILTNLDVIRLLYRFREINVSPPGLVSLAPQLRNGEGPSACETSVPTVNGPLRPFSAGLACGVAFFVVVPLRSVVRAQLGGVIFLLAENVTGDLATLAYKSI